ncbi:MAG TPA: hypothetical protein VM681_06165 [Candidatus Thermoplasmatota archaeon]|nr:hypothetical protein [Candidatus Thermoplasmatota archaeon]
MTLTAQDSDITVEGLRALLRSRLADRIPADAAYIRKLVDDLSKAGIVQLADVDRALAQAKDAALAYEADLQDNEVLRGSFEDVGLARTALSIMHPAMADDPRGLEPFRSLIRSDAHPAPMPPPARAEDLFEQTVRGHGFAPKPPGGGLMAKLARPRPTYEKTVGRFRIELEEDPASKPDSWVLVGRTTIEPQKQGKYEIWSEPVARGQDPRTGLRFASDSREIGQYLLERMDVYKLLTWFEGRIRVRGRQVEVRADVGASLSEGIGTLESALRTVADTAEDWT